MLQKSTDNADRAESLRTQVVMQRFSLFLLKRVACKIQCARAYGIASEMG
jgi:hypothetical protein